MPRPKAGTAQQGRAYQLYKEGLGPTAIFEKLCEEFEDPVSARTVSTWLRGFRGLGEEVTQLDNPFEWHRLKEYGLPWEAGGYLMEMWAWAREFWSDLAETLGEPEPPPTTVREFRWWWRVASLVPKVSKFDVYVWAQAFVWQELLKEVLGEPVNLAGLEAYLAYRPWEGAEKLSAYNDAIAKKRIPSPPDIWDEGMLRRRIKGAIGQVHTPLLGFGGDPSGRIDKLPSTVFKECAHDLVYERVAFNKFSAGLDKLEREIQEREEWRYRPWQV